MTYLKRTLRRNRQKLQVFGWASLGFILLFCILTVQLSATEGPSPAKFQAAKRLPSPAPHVLSGIAPSATSLVQLEKPTSKNSTIPVASAYLATGEASQVSHTFPARSTGVDSVPPPSPHVYPNGPFPHHTYPTAQNLIPDPSTSPNAIYLQQQPTAGEVIYSDSQAMPRSNYFGVGPDDVCDEWSGFCKCKQKMFNRRGEACSDKSRRFQRDRNSDDCGCGN